MLAPFGRVLRSPMPLGQRGETVQCREQKPAEPDAFATATFAYAIHTVVPIASAHKWQAMRTRGQTLVERERAVVEQARPPFGNRGFEEGIVLFLAQDRSLKEGDYLRQDRSVAGDLNILCNSI